jgi:hypothetical protein
MDAARRVRILDVWLFHLCLAFELDDRPYMNYEASRSRSAANAMQFDRKFARWPGQACTRCQLAMAPCVQCAMPYLQDGPSQKMRVNQSAHVN